MSIHYDITTDLRFQYGVETGIEQGIEQGLEKGLKQGEYKKTRRIVEKALQKGVMSIQEIADFAEVDFDFVIKIQNELNGI